MESLEGVSLECDGSSGEKSLEYAIAHEMRKAFEVWKQRHRKYGTRNIAATGEIGCVVRGFDKLARIKNAHESEQSGAAKDETCDDAWLDLLNYSAIALVVRAKKWPGAA